MLFKKNENKINFQKELTDADITPEKEAEEKNIINESSAPIYILGDSTLAYYLATKFSCAGEKVVIVSNNFTSSEKIYDSINLKEDYNLKKSKSSFTTTFLIKEQPKLLVITSPIKDFRASITTLSPSKLKACPILCLTPLKDISYLQAFLDKEIIMGFFDGYIGQKDTNITLYGKAPIIKICLNAKHNEEVDFIVKAFHEIQINCEIEADKEICFWNYFAFYAATSLISALYNKNIFDITKDKIKRETLRTLANDIASICQSKSINIDTEELLRRIYNMPANYATQLQKDMTIRKTAELNYICSILMEASQKNKCSVPCLTDIIRQIHNIIIV